MNAAFGHEAAGQLTTGQNNVMIGLGADGPPDGNDNVIIGNGTYVPSVPSFRDGNVVLMAGGKPLLHVDKNGVVRVNGRIMTDGVVIRDALNGWLRKLLGVE